ncbi:MAG: Rdx family protein [Chloroflexi bacterium]|nr:Rdx family protein [Chloroflexota bacterium]
MAGEALNRAGERIESFRLIPSEHGKFHISIDGDLVAWHRHEPDAHIFPDLQDMMAAIDERIGKQHAS